MARRSLADLGRSTSGATAVEFAIYASLFFGLLFGTVSALVLGYSSTSLNVAVEKAARCRSLAVACTDAASTQAYAAARYSNLTGQTPVFVSDTPSCGNRVTGTLNYKLNWIIASTTIPLAATACFP